MFLDFKNWVVGEDHMIDISILTYEKSILNLCHCIKDISYISYIHTCNSDMILVFMYPSTSYRFLSQLHCKILFDGHQAARPGRAMGTSAHVFS